MYIYIYIIKGTLVEGSLALPIVFFGLTVRANLRTKILDVRGFGSNIILSLRLGILRSVGDFAEIMIRRILGSSDLSILSHPRAQEIQCCSIEKTCAKKQHRGGIGYYQYDSYYIIIIIVIVFTMFMIIIISLESLVFISIYCFFVLLIICYLLFISYQLLFTYDYYYYYNFIRMFYYSLFICYLFISCYLRNNVIQRHINAVVSNGVVPKSQIRKLASKQAPFEIMKTHICIHIYIYIYIYRERITVTITITITITITGRIIMFIIESPFTWSAD